MAYYAVQLSAVTAQSPSGMSTFTSSNQSDVIYTVLDSGSTYTYLPDYIITAIYSYLGATSTGANDVAIPCNRTTAESVFSFSFGGPRGPKINVPISDFVVPRDPRFENFTFSDGTPACTLSIVPSASYQAVLGDSLLRSAYVVYDIDSQQIALAQSKLLSTADGTISEITPDGIPGINASMPALPWNVTALRALGRDSPISNLSTVAGAAASTTIPADVSSALPVVMQGSVTAVGPAGAMWTGAGIPIPGEIRSACQDGDERGAWADWDRVVDRDSTETSHTDAGFTTYRFGRHGSCDGEGDWDAGGSVCRFGSVFVTHGLGGLEWGN